MKNLKFLFFIFILAFYSCNEQHFYEQYVEIPNHIWNQSEIVKFEVDVEDIDAYYNVAIGVHHNDKYEYGNLWLFAKVTSPTGKTQIDTIDMIFVRDDNNWAGKCSSGNCKLLASYVDSIKFVEPGVYFFEFEQGVRKEDLPNISKVGLIINKFQK